MQCNTAPYIIGHGKHRPCKNRAETVHPWLTKQKSHEIFRSTASTVDIPNHWDLQQRRLRPVADARRSCWGSGQQDASAAQGTRRMLGAATRNSKQQPTGLIACGAVRRRLVRVPSIVQTKRKTSTQRVLVFLGASSDTELFKNHRSTICFQGHRIATCLYRTPMGSCIEKTVAFYIPHNLKIIKYAQRSLLPSPGANERCFFCLQRKEASVKWQYFV